MMISKIHKVVIQELEDKKPRYRILNDLIVSFCALVLNELKHSDESIRKAMLKFASKRLEFTFRLLQNYQDFFDGKNFEQFFPDYPEDFNNTK